MILLRIRALACISVKDLAQVRVRTYGRTLDPKLKNRIAEQVKGRPSSGWGFWASGLRFGVFALQGYSQKHIFFCGPLFLPVLRLGVPCLLAGV